MTALNTKLSEVLTTKASGRVLGTSLTLRMSRIEQG